MAAIRRSPRDLLRHGAFFGLRMVQRTAPGFTIAHHASNNARVDEHEHSEGHFILITSGDYISRACGRRAPDIPMFIYNPPGTVHADRFQQGVGTFFSICSSGDSDNPDAEPSDPQFVASAIGYAIASKLLRELAGWSEDSPLVGEGLCLELQSAIVTERPPRHRDAPRWLASAWDALRDRSAEPITIADVARDVGVHPVHLARAFREVYGASPGELLRDWRVRNAARLLRESTQSICDVALAAGFADQSHFSKVFKTHYGVSPGRFRGT